MIITNWRISYEDRRGFDHFNPGVYQHDPDLVPAQYRTSMDQSTISNASENRNDPIHQRRSPRYPRLPCKLWIREEKRESLSGMDRSIHSEHHPRYRPGLRCKSTQWSFGRRCGPKKACRLRRGQQGGCPL